MTVDIHKGDTGKRDELSCLLNVDAKKFIDKLGRRVKKIGKSEKYELSVNKSAE